MATATLTTKGQVTIPAAVRCALGLHAGDRVDFVELERGQFAIVAATKSVSDLKGLLNKPAKPVSIEDMHEAIATKGAGLA
ncbi:AbrB/MazE/SpoVT family DNA-binding domain-containing protein [Chitinimonas sp. BJB300]|uniref:AbrB/MazE/SpoVT family DNA-binding domain-containing protein n=1 Tax=Chitinimonas sp. BJB300 TaxID=1559339 RepID=UPI000C10DDBA|nr:type II toxin-antitoxin system PrlF family antitoxin [Chitinimonas sp. BJB300]PHV09618.1 AbrB family transcriptional regulator [Chitinimonas sp. BJB300]TSJ84504.1 AbrB/MazE/SpoVT family DNA-binding domain-containing protein [Chitinimonas sp. BJB300]